MATVTLRITPSFDLFVASKVVFGLCSLAETGEIEFRVEAADAADCPEADCMVWLELSPQRGARPTRIALDLADSAEHLDDASLDWSDVYFKRSFVRALAARARRDIIPLGLQIYYGGRQWPLRQLQLEIAKIRQSIAHGQSLRSAVSNTTSRLRASFVAPSSGDFENDGRWGRNGLVLFQTRVWPPQPSTDDLEQLNEERAALVRSLRSGLRDRVIAGLMPYDFSRQRYPDLLAQSNTNRRDYAAFSRRFSVGVYSRGIHHSLAHKLSEYLAGGLCIVSDKLVHELPVPLVRGENYLEFSSADECVRLCETLLDDPSLEAEMSRKNFSYYMRWVEPVAQLRDIFSRALERRAMDTAALPLARTGSGPN